MPIIDGVSYRARDLDKVEIPWEQRDVVYELEDGWTIERIFTPADLATEGGIMGHCAASHAYYVNKGVEYMFSLRNPNGVSKATIHAKPTELVNVTQPEDAEISYYAKEIDGLQQRYRSTYYDHYAVNGCDFIFNDTSLRLIAVVTNSATKYLSRCVEWLVKAGADPEHPSLENGNGYAWEAGDDGW